MVMQMKEVVYFELNNWMPGTDYPAEEPFNSWMDDQKYFVKFRDKEWVTKNKLVVVESMVDMSLNYCISAPIDFVEKMCPKLLTKYSTFIREEDDGDPPYGQFGSPFMEYEECNIGLHCWDDITREYFEPNYPR